MIISWQVLHWAPSDQSQVHCNLKCIDNKIASYTCILHNILELDTRLKFSFIMSDTH